jgi:hypothetical protein
MPFALSICRVDENYAWIVAMAQQESTGSFRDLMMTGKQATDMAKDYFEERLWKRGRALIEHGAVVPDWRDRLQAELEGK